MVLTAHRLDGGKSTYAIPTILEALAHSKRTLGKQFDAIERKQVTGSLPMVWARVQ